MSGATNPRFLSAAVPRHIFPPLFNSYAASDGHHFGVHVDNAVRGDRLTGLRIIYHNLIRYWAEV